jgi:hypothetical protein
MEELTETEDITLFPSNGRHLCIYMQHNVALLSLVTKHAVT